MFDIAEARAIRPLNNTVDYPSATVMDMRTTVEDTIEKYTGAMVPRYAYETKNYPRWPDPLVLKHDVRAIRSVAIDGVALSVDQLNNLDIRAGLLHGLPGRPRWNSTVTIGYEYGRDRPTERIRRAALLLTKIWLVSGPVDDRTSTFTSTEGGTYSLVTAGRGGSLVGIPEVDAAIKQEIVPLAA
jgi:hypothetical protein